MKKLNLLITAGIMVLSLAGCSNGATPESTETEENTTASDGAQTDDEISSDIAGTDGESAEAAGTNALVVYFSATGNTKAAAETLAQMQGAELVEIVPEEPYTADDLNYNDHTSRATAEQNDPKARPAIAQSIDNLDNFDVVYVGYPIWWGDMPRIMYTFFDTYDLSGKVIAPFCTSGGSGLSGTPGTIAELEPEATVLDGAHVDGNTEAVLSDWLTAIGLN